MFLSQKQYRFYIREYFDKVVSSNSLQSPNLEDRGTLVLQCYRINNCTIPLYIRFAKHHITLIVIFNEESNVEYHDRIVNVQFSEMLMKKHFISFEILKLHTICQLKGLTTIHFHIQLNHFVSLFKPKHINPTIHCYFILTFV